MQPLQRLVSDTNGDGYPDDIRIRFVIDPPEGLADRALVAALLDAAARLGLETHAIPLPLAQVDAAVAAPDNVETIVVRRPEDILGILDEPEADTWQAPANDSATMPCLTRLFTIDGALVDRDGDLLPDATRIRFDLPAVLPAPLVAALGNLAARIGLESGGVTFPLVRDAGTAFSVRPGDGSAALRIEHGGWLAEGDSEQLTVLINQIAADWPHVGIPGAGGVGAAMSTLRRWLSGDGPEPNTPGDVIWETEWSADWEVDRLLAAVKDILQSTGDSKLPGAAQFTVFASEPAEIRERLTENVKAVLSDAGYDDARVTVLSAFKTGLSWLLEVVLPDLRELPVSRLRVEYRRYESDGEVPALDLPIRWLQEIFPAPEMLARSLDISMDAIEITEVADMSAPIFVAEALGADGGVLDRWECSPLWRTQPWSEAYPESGSVCVTTGGISVAGDTTRQMAVPTDLEAFWSFWQRDVLPRVYDEIESRGGAYSRLQPFFGELLVEVWVSEPNSRLGVREENDSAAEALAEDIYFTTLDSIDVYAQQRTGERGNAPGAVIPIVHVTAGEAPRARVTLRAAPAHPDLPRPDVRVTSLRLDEDGFILEVSVDVDGEATLTLDRLRHLAGMDQTHEPSVRAVVQLGDEVVSLSLPLPALLRPESITDAPGPAPMDENIWGDAVVDTARALASFDEVSAWVEDHSYLGRPIVALALTTTTPGRLHSPTKAAIFKPTHLIIARHHANEISSTNAAFQLAWLCANDPEWRRYLDNVNVLLLPYENPDGAALHASLASYPEARDWKHHAARYNALGHEYGELHFDPDARVGEARARASLWRRWPADVVVDNHGVPSHEWVQPFAGFGSPPRFQVSYWVVQALLYGIIWHVYDDVYPEHQTAAVALRDAVSAMIKPTDIGDWNRVYGESYRFWGQSRLPERFPGEFHDDMLWHISGRPAGPEGRGFNSRYPRTTVLSWITEVNDETASGEHLDRVARAHLYANRATLELLHKHAPAIRRWRTDGNDGQYTIRVGRDRPLRLGDSVDMDKG